MRPLRVGVDLDGPTYPFMQAYRRWWAAHRGVAIHTLQWPLPEGASWSWPVDSWGGTPEEHYASWSAGVSDARIYATEEPTPGARDGLWSLAAAGHTLVVVTARTPPGLEREAERQTRTWWDMHDLPHAEFHFNEDKCCVPTDVFIEDNPRNYAALEAAGTKPYLYTFPWNVHLEGFRRVAGWAQFVDAVETTSLELERRGATVQT